MQWYFPEPAEQVGSEGHAEAGVAHDFEGSEPAWAHHFDLVELGGAEAESRSAP